MLMVHAGVLPQWDVNLTLELADEFAAGAARAELEGDARRPVRQRAAIAGSRA